MKFILNFIFFGILFYAIWYFFPDAFMKLVNATGAVFTYIRDVITAIIHKLNESKPAPTPTGMIQMMLVYLKLL